MLLTDDEIQAAYAETRAMDGWNNLLSFARRIESAAIMKAADAMDARIDARAENPDANWAAADPSWLRQLVGKDM